MAANLRCCTDLLNAVERNCLGCVRIFGDDPEQHKLTNIYGQSVLHLAIMHPTLMEHLAPRMSLYINTRDFFGRPPICFITKCGIIAGKFSEILEQKIISSIKILVKNGALINITDNEGYSPLHHAAYNGLLNLFKCLINLGAIHSKTNLGKNILHLSVQSINEDLTKYILENALILNVDQIHDQTLKGTTTLHHACSSDYPQHFLLLSAENIHENINKKDTDGLTPLMTAIDYHNYMYGSLVGNPDYPNKYAEIVNFLLINGADTGIKDNKGMTALDYARVSNNPEIIKLLTEHQDLPPY